MQPSRREQIRAARSPIAPCNEIHRPPPLRRSGCRGHLGLSKFGSRPRAWGSVFLAPTCSPKDLVIMQNRQGSDPGLC